MKRFWWNWPSLLVELLSGFAVIIGVAGAALIVTHWPTFSVRLAVGTAFSLLYELLLDANGWSLKDVLQREIGVMIAVGLWSLLSR